MITVIERPVLRSAFFGLRYTPLPRWLGAAHGTNDQGASLDPDVALLLGMANLRPDVPWAKKTAPVARASFEVQSQLIEGPERPLASVRSISVAGLPARLYVPHGDTQHRLLVYFHGGGWVVGSLRSHHRLCQALAEEGHQRVLAVDYRLAPEHPFPAPVEDALAAFRWARAHAEQLGATPRSLAVGGDSAGGNLAAVVCQQLREAGEAQPAFQLLIYPATDFRRETPSHRALGQGYLLTRESLDWYEERYAPEILDVRCSPLLADSHAGLAPAIIVNAGFDPLRDDGAFYGDALRAAGVPVDQHDHPGQVHGFLSMAGVIPAAARAVTEVAGNCAERYG